MELTLKRDILESRYTQGMLSVDGEYACFSLEDTVRAPGIKIPGETAIPPGRYRVVITHSPHFDRPLPLLLDVPGFEGVRIHPGNYPSDTQGCILVGNSRKPGEVGNSRAAFAALFEKIEAALQDGSECWITIT